MITFLRWVHNDDTITYQNLCLDDLKPLGAYALIVMPALPALISHYL